MDDGRLTVLLHGLGLLVKTFSLGVQLGRNGLCLCLALRLDGLCVCESCLTTTFRLRLRSLCLCLCRSLDLLGGLLGLVQFCVCLTFPLDLVCLGLLRTAVLVGVSLLADRGVKFLLLDLDLRLLDLGFLLLTDKIGLSGCGLDGLALRLLFDLVRGLGLGLLHCGLSGEFRLALRKFGLAFRDLEV